MNGISATILTSHNTKRTESRSLESSIQSRDRHTTSMPYCAVSFSATQRFWWQCTCYENGALQYPLTDRTITRKVLQNDGVWQYQITKSGQTGAANLP